MTTIMEQLADRLALADELAEPATVLQELIASLGNAKSTFDLGRLYALNTTDFELAMALIADWRFRRHLYAGRGGVEEALEQARRALDQAGNPGSLPEAVH